MASSSAAKLGAPLADELELVADAGDALFDAPAVQFELLLAGPLEADAAFLAFEVGPEAAEAGDQVAQLGQFDLKAAFDGPGALGEDIEDELGAVDDADAQKVLEGASLGGGEVVVEDGQAGAGSLELLGDLDGFPAADVGGRMDVAETAEGFAGGFRLGGGCEGAEFAERVFDFGAGDVAELDGHQPGAFGKIGLGGMHHWSGSCWDSGRIWRASQSRSQSVKYQRSRSGASQAGGLGEESKAR